MSSIYPVVIGVALIGVWFSYNQDKAPVDKRREIEAINRKVILDLVRDVFGNNDVDSLDNYVAPNLIQHNPLVADGREALKAAVREMLNFPAKDIVVVQRIIAEGDLLLLHFKFNFLGVEAATMEIFRFEDGKIAEIWKVFEPMPLKSANDHPMF